MAYIILFFIGLFVGAVAVAGAMFTYVVAHAQTAAHARN